MQILGKPDLNTGVGMTTDVNREVGVQKNMETTIGETSSGIIVTDNTVSKKRKRKNMKNNNRDLGDSLSTRDNGKEKWKKKPELNKRPTLGEILNAQYLPSLETAKGETDSGTMSTDNLTSKKQEWRKLYKKSMLSTGESTQEVLSTTKVLERKYGETVLAKNAAPDAIMVSKGDHTEVANGKTGESETTNLIVNDVKKKKKRKKKANSKNKRPTLGEILDPQYLQNLEAAETGSGTTSTDYTASEKQKKKELNRRSDLGDILGTYENTQVGLSIPKVLDVKSDKSISGIPATSDANTVSKGDHTEVADGRTQEHEPNNLIVNGKEKKKKRKKPKSEVGPGTPKVLEVKSDETILGKPATSDANMVSRDHTEVANGKMQENEPNNLNVNGKEKKKKRKKPKSNNKGPSLDESLNTQYLQNLEAAKHEMGSESTVLKSIACPQVANSQITQVTTSGKKLLILDVNGLLAEVVTGRPKDIVADKYITRRRAIFKRPYLDDFLCFCFERFNVGIWSSRQMKNLVPVINFLLGDLKKNLLFMWDACKCTNSGVGTLEESHKNIVVKDLRKIWDEDGPKNSWVKGTFHESNTLLVDDSPYKALLNPKHTGIFPASYSYKDRDDNFLGPKGELQTYLEGLAVADDVKTYVEQHPFGQGAIDEQSPHWAFYSSIIERLNDKNIMGSLHKKNKEKRRRCMKEFYHPY